MNNKKNIFCCYLKNVVIKLDEKKNHEIQTALHYKLLYNIKHSKNEVKNIQTVGCNGVRFVYSTQNTLWNNVDFFHLFTKKV